MPTIGYSMDQCERRATARRRAEQQVRAKFPGLMQGTPGWNRAVGNRYDRLLRSGHGDG